MRPELWRVRVAVRPLHAQVSAEVSRRRQVGVIALLWVNYDDPLSTFYITCNYYNLPVLWNYNSLLT